ncbi:MAG: hypothetical protein JXQ66_07565 [Campylobacterales bacterium]|nr:hypothetical protein [Campylobacterales bacterium]
MIRSVFLISIFCISLFSYTKSSDSKNVYYSSEHFKTIIGVGYKDDANLQSLAYKMLDAAEESWKREVVELGFIQPKNSQYKKIDIYIANKSAYNYDLKIYETIDASYAGWAISYSDGTPYFVLNPVLNDIQIKVTIAHEFFHTIQYAYFDETKLDDEKWFSNIWWLEATAVLMEDEVYDDLNDYINFLNPFFEKSYKNFELYNGYHEYSMVVFAKYIKENFGIQIIKDSLSKIESSGKDGFFEIIDLLLEQNHNSNIEIELSRFAKWVSDAPKYFEEGALYPSLVHFSKNDTNPIEKGGMKIIDNVEDGWNMVSLPTLDIDELEIKNQISIWGFENTKWLNNVDKSGYEQLTQTDSSKGYWINSYDKSSIYYTYFDKSDNEIASLPLGWHLLGTTAKLETNYFESANVLIWQYNHDNGWSAFSNNEEMSQKISQLGINELNYISAYSSYWVYIIQ